MAGESLRALRRVSLAVSLAAGLGIDASSPALATTWPVGRCNDIAGKGGDTLRQAIGHAAVNDIVDLSTLPATCTGFTLTGGEIPINVGTLSIVSPRNITINGAGTGRIFNHTPAGGILYLRYLTLTNGVSASGSGGCATTGGKLTLSHATITGCLAGQNGGGASAASCNIVYSAVDGNTALDSGLFCGGGDAVFVHSSVSGNVSGGGVFAGTVEAYYSTFSNNTRNDGPGGGIHALGNVKLVASTVSGNGAGGNGGGIDTSSNVTAQDSILSGNISTAGGGAIYAHSSATLTDTSVVGNASNDFAGGVAAPAALTLVRTTLSGNSTGGSGGGAYSSHMTITNSTISGNYADSGAGLSSGVTINAYNSTIAFNRAYSSAAGAAGGIVSYRLNMSSSIVARNSAAPAATAADVFVSGADAFLPVYSLIVSCNRATLSLASDPRLTPLALHGGTVATHALSLGSPAIDAGKSGGLATDQRGPGYARSVGGAADIGAFERQAGEDELFYSGFD